ncbi:MAG: lysophospholipid acyltransferase family protein [Candidatus Promineifilaceae bacterium]
MIIVYFLRGLIRFVAFFVASIKSTGTENIPERGPYIVVVNHMSKADPPLVYITLPPTKLRFFAGEKWENHFIFGPSMAAAGAIYINRGEVDRKALREATEAIKAGSIFGLAPEGTRSRIGKLIRARDGAAYLATRTNIPVLPMGVVNTEILGSNMTHLKRTALEVHVGKPIILPDIGHRPRSTELSAYTHLIMVHIAALLPERYWGYYKDSPALKALLAGEDPWPYCLQVEGVTEEKVKE